MHGTIDSKMNKYLNEFIKPYETRFDKWQTEIIREFDITLNKHLNKTSVLSSDIFLLFLNKDETKCLPNIPEYKQGMFDFDIIIRLDNIDSFNFEHESNKFLDVELIVLRSKLREIQYSEGVDISRVLWKRFYLTPSRQIVPVHSM